MNRIRKKTNMLTDYRHSTFSISCMSPKTDGQLWIWADNEGHTRFVGSKIWIDILCKKNLKKKNSRHNILIRK